MILDEYEIKEVPANLIKLPASFNPSPEALRKEIERDDYCLPQIRDDGVILTGHLTVLALLNKRKDKINCKVFKASISYDEESLIKLENKLPQSEKWIDQITFEKTFHQTAQKLYGQAKQNNKGGWGLNDTAKRLNIAVGKLCEDLNLARAMEIDPFIATFEEKQDAKAFYKLQESLAKANIRESSSYSGKINYAKLIQPELYLRTFDKEILDCIITDRQNNTHWTRDVFEQCFRLLGNNSYFLLFCPTLLEFITDSAILESIGFIVQDHPIIWINEGSKKLSKEHWQTGQNYSFILVAAKGWAALKESRWLMNSVISAKNKEVAIRKLLEIFTFENDLILDPFAGELELSRVAKRWICIEKDRDKFRKGCLVSGLDFYTGEKDGR